MNSLTFAECQALSRIHENHTNDRRKMDLQHRIFVAVMTKKTAARDAGGKGC